MELITKGGHASLWPFRAEGTEVKEQRRRRSGGEGTEESRRRKGKDIIKDS